MTADRPATRFWAKAEEERRALQATTAARFRHQMLEAGGLEPDDLSDQARRTLAWLAESDDPTVNGVADLLKAARVAGHHAARNEPEPSVETSLAALHRRFENPAVGL